MDLDPWYVTGFAEGEGSFTYSRSGPRFALYFAVKLVRADRTILESMQRFFGGIGTIYDVGPRAPSDRSGYTKAASYYRVCRRDQLMRIVVHFDAYPPRGSKLASYRIWREMVLLKQAPMRTSVAEMRALADRLTAASPRHGQWSSAGLQGSGTGLRASRPRGRMSAPPENGDGSPP